MTTFVVILTKTKTTFSGHDRAIHTLTTFTVMRRTDEDFMIRYFAGKASPTARYNKKPRTPKQS